MRYADGPSAEVAVWVDAAPEVVWGLVTDIDLPARFSDEFAGADWDPATPGPALGARFVGRNEHPTLGAWQTESVIVVHEPGRCFGWDVQGEDGTAASWRFELAPERGGTALRQRARMGPAPSGLTIAIEAMPDKEERIIARRLEEWTRNMQATLEGIKAAAEAPAGP